MFIDYHVQRNARRCAVTDRAFAPGEEFVSMLVPPADDPQSELIERRDCCLAAWQGPPENAIGWWRARLPDATNKPRMAPGEVLLDLFDRWADDASRVESRYVLTLLLIRRRVLKQHADEAGDGPPDDDPATGALAVYCPDRDAVYKVTVASPGDDRVEAIQSELFALLYDGQPTPPTQQPGGDDSIKQAG